MQRWFLHTLVLYQLWLKHAGSQKDEETPSKETIPPTSFQVPQQVQMKKGILMFIFLGLMRSFVDLGYQKVESFA